METTRKEFLSKATTHFKHTPPLPASLTLLTSGSSRVQLSSPCAQCIEGNGQSSWTVPRQLPRPVLSSPSTQLSCVAPSWVYSPPRQSLYTHAREGPAAECSYHLLVGHHLLTSWRITSGRSIPPNLRTILTSFQGSRPGRQRLRREEGGDGSKQKMKTQERDAT